MYKSRVRGVFLGSVIQIIFGKIVGWIPGIKIKLILFLMEILL